MAFRALIVDRLDGKISAAVKQINEDALPQGNVIVNVEWSGLNYKDGLCLTGQGGLVRNYPHVPGIDFAGSVAKSSDKRFSPGDKVVLTGWGVGERHWGGYAQKARVNPDWLVKLPPAISTRQAMALGTAGLTAMLAINRLEENGLCPQNGPVLVTGASGGVGTVAILLLKSLGYRIAALTGRPDNEAALKALGADEIIPRSEMETPQTRPLLGQTWAAAIDCVGGIILANVLKQMNYGSGVTAIGLAGSAELPASVIPFILRGISLFGIDSVMQPTDKRQQAWQRLAELVDFARLESAISEATLEDLPGLGKKILKGEIAGRVIVAPGA